MSTPTRTRSVTATRPRTPTSSGPPVAAQAPTDDRYGPGGLDAELHTAVRHAGMLRRGFYTVVLVVALAGQVSGAMHALHIPLLAAIPAVGALELGGVVVMTNADVRRRLGERAVGSRMLSAGVAAGAVMFNWTAHPDPLLGGFFAGMSALGYLVWLTHAENSRRDRLRALDALPPTTPAYEPCGHWIRHPRLTHRARSLAKTHPHLGLYESLTAARAELSTERRRNAIAAVLHRKIRTAVDPTTADIALAVYDFDEIASRLARRADYDGLTNLIAEDLAPSRLAGAQQQPHQRPIAAGEALRAPHEPISTSAQQPITASVTLKRPWPGADSEHLLPLQAGSSERAEHETSSTTWSTAQAEYPDVDDIVLPEYLHAAMDGTGTATFTSGPDASPATTLRCEPEVASAAGCHTAPAPATSATTSPDHPLETNAADGDPVDGNGEPDQPGPGRQQTAAAAVAYWRRRDPDLGIDEIAAHIGRSKRTVYRHWHTDT